MKHKWHRPDRNNEQYCERGCGYVRCLLVPYSVRASKPIPHYRPGGANPTTGKSYRWSEGRPPCVEVKP